MNDNRVIREYDDNGNLIYYKNNDTGFEAWNEYDKNNNKTHYKNSNGHESWKEYDENGNEIHFKTSNGYESWSEYDENNNSIHYKNSDGDERWYVYNENGEKIMFTSYNTYKIFLSKINIKESIKEIVNKESMIKNICEDKNGCFKNIILPAIMNSTDNNILETIVAMMVNQSVIYDKLLNNIAQYGSKELIEKCREDINDIFQ